MCPGDKNVENVENMSRACVDDKATRNRTFVFVVTSQDGRVRQCFKTKLVGIVL